MIKIENILVNHKFNRKYKILYKKYISKIKSKLLYY